MVGDSPNVSICEDETGLSEELEKELDRRYQQAIKNPQDGKSWEDVKMGLIGEFFIIQIILWSRQILAMMVN